jgi:hypothetical protein
MPGTTPLRTATAGADDAPTTEITDGAAVGTARDEPSSVESAAHAERPTTDTDSTNTADANDGNESEMDAHTPPPDDCDRTAPPSTDAIGVDHDRRKRPSALPPVPFASGVVLLTQSTAR